MLLPFPKHKLRPETRGGVEIRACKGLTGCALKSFIVSALPAEDVMQRLDDAAGFIQVKVELDDLRDPSVCIDPQLF